VSFDENGSLAFGLFRWGVCVCFVVCDWGRCCIIMAFAVWMVLLCLGVCMMERRFHGCVRFAFDFERHELVLCCNRIELYFYRDHALL